MVLWLYLLNFIMIIKTNKKLSEGLIDARFDKDKLKVLHRYDVTPILKAAYEERKASIGRFNPILGDKWEKVATVPSIIFAEHPEFEHDPKALNKWLKTEEGKAYRVSNRKI